MKASENKVVLTRIDKTNKSTLGIFSVTKPDGFAWICKSLELPDKDNRQKISCIPVGEYNCIYSRSPHMSEIQKMDIFTYEVLDVPGRAGIRIHSANYTRQLLGCIALGDMHKDLDIDGITDVLHSGKTISDFEALMEMKPFKLKIQ